MLSTNDADDEHASGSSQVFLAYAQVLQSNAHAYDATWLFAWSYPKNR
jgi:hypothetical protein